MESSIAVFIFRLRLRPAANLNHNQLTKMLRRCYPTGRFFCRREALGISTLDSEYSGRGSSPRGVSCTPESFNELRSFVWAVGVVLLGFLLFAVGGFSAGLCVGPLFGLYCGPTSWQRPGAFPGGPPPQY